MSNEFIVPNVTLTITTYEKVGDKYIPTVTHQFHGNTIDEAYAVLNAHSKYDSFFKSSLIGKFVTQKGTIIYLKNSEVKITYKK